jgi:hypothetical protein
VSLSSSFYRCLDCIVQPNTVQLCTPTTTTTAATSLNSSAVAGLTVASVASVHSRGQQLDSATASSSTADAVAVVQQQQHLQQPQQQQQQHCRHGRDFCSRCFGAAARDSPHHHRTASSSTISYSSISGRNSCAAVLSCCHRQHSFVRAEAGCEPLVWQPVQNPGMPGAPSGASSLILAMQSREITTADFDVLLQLDRK